MSDETSPRPCPRCPRCGGEMLDLRGTGFNAEKVRKLGVCFMFNTETLECRRGDYGYKDGGKP